MTTSTLEKTETHNFAAETARVLQLMIHALYTNRDIFLRELISNASDACDKLRYEAQQNQALLGDAPELAITLSFDEKAHTLTIADTGIGMNRADLMTHLGTIAKSGTAEFLENLPPPLGGRVGGGHSGQNSASNAPHPTSPRGGEEQSEINLIGQFGVGFYSAFMVADKVVVESRKAGEADAWRWESDGLGSYTIHPLEGRARGTSITLHMKADAAEYLDRFRLGHIVSTYSDHISFPITLTDAEGVTHTLNDGSAIWTRPKADISDEQYQNFYRDIAHTPEKPWAVFHTKAEGKTEYTSLLFVPGIKPFDLFHPERRCRVKLYVKRVFIAEEGVELVPPYLRFLRGVVDSADLPLNISRETLQKSPLLDAIRDAVTGRILTDLKKRAENDPAEYTKFWENFGAVLKEGLCEANAPREKILEACRFSSTSPSPRRGEDRRGASLAPTSEDNGDSAASLAPHPSNDPLDRCDPALRGEELVSLTDYKSRMREGQEAIYYLTGDALGALKTSPQLEGFTKRGIEVLLLTDHVDDFWPNVTQKYGDLPFRSVTKSGADLDKFPLEGEAANAEEKPETSDAIKTLCDTMKSLLGDDVSDVRPTRKLSDTPICLGVAEGAMDMRMERFLVEHKQLPKRMAKLVEINPTHPVITALAASITQHGLTLQVEDALRLLYDQALIAEGEPVADASAFARRLATLMQKGLV